MPDLSPTLLYSSLSGSGLQFYHKCNRIFQPFTNHKSSLSGTPMDIPLPMEKIQLPVNDTKHTNDGDKYAVLVGTGCYNPPTYMHLRMFELARDVLRSAGYHVIAGYMSTVFDGYKKQGLVSAEHRLRMCNLASESSDFIMVDPWEAKQPEYQCTLSILQRIDSCIRPRISRGSLNIMFLCGSDLLEGFNLPQWWIPEQVRMICRDHGIVCIRREGQDIEEMISNHQILNEYSANVRVVDELVPNQISSTRLRACVARGLSIKYLTPDSVIDYIKASNLYQNSDKKQW